jgi:hypothetical protein
MRRLRTGLATFALSALVGIVIATGCSASGGDDAITDTAPTPPATDTAQLPPPGNPLPQDPPPPPSKDAGKDAQVDAGPPPPTPGTACSDPNKIVSKQCGACGTQSTICQSTTDGGMPTWTDYSVCTGELPGGCIPGTTSTQSCGNCGTQTVTCSKYCAQTFGSCTGQPVNSCVPLSLDFANAGCSTASTYKQRSCKTDCSWDNFSTACSAPPAIIEVPPNVTQQSSTLVTLSASKTITRLKDDTACPNAPIGTLATAFEYVQIHNSNPKPALVTIFNSMAPGGSVIHTQLATYAGSTPPSTAAQRTACVKGLNTFGDDTISGDTNFSTLSDTDRPTVPANGSILVYNAGYDASAVGVVKLTVQLDALQ